MAITEVNDEATSAHAGAATPPGAPRSDAVNDELVSDELLVEEISIDGMCGVY